MKKPPDRQGNWQLAHKSMTHVYGHNRLVYNEEADALAKAGAALSKVHKPRRVEDMLHGSRVASRRKQMGRGIKHKAAVQEQTKA